METSRIFSRSKNSSATDTFSSFIWRKVGLAWYFRYIFFWLSTSSRAMSRSPSLRSNCKSAILLFTHFKCSLHQRVKVFCWIFFHGASSAKSFSVTGISLTGFPPRFLSSIVWSCSLAFLSLAPLRLNCSVSCGPESFTALWPYACALLFIPVTTSTSDDDTFTVWLLFRSCPNLLPVISQV